LIVTNGAMLFYSFQNTEHIGTKLDTNHRRRFTLTTES